MNRVYFPQISEGSSAILTQSARGCHRYNRPTYLGEPVVSTFQRKVILARYHLIRVAAYQQSMAASC